MPAPMKRRPSRAEVAKSLQELALLWARPRLPQGKAAGGLAPGERLKDNTFKADSSTSTAPRGAR